MTYTRVYVSIHVYTSAYTYIKTSYTYIKTAYTYIKTSLATA